MTATLKSGRPRSGGDLVLTMPPRTTSASFDYAPPISCFQAPCRPDHRTEPRFTPSTATTAVFDKEGFAFHVARQLMGSFARWRPVFRGIIQPLRHARRSMMHAGAPGPSGYRLRNAKPSIDPGIPLQSALMTPDKDQRRPMELHRAFPAPRGCGDPHP